MLLGDGVFAEPLVRFDFEARHMGVAFRAAFYAPDRATATVAADRVFARIDALDDALSDWDPESELSRLSRTAGGGCPVAISDDLRAVLARGRAIANGSGGAFDVTAGPLVELWRRSRRTGALPDAAMLADARARVGTEHWDLDEAEPSVTLRTPGMRLDLGGIAKGYAADQAVALLRSLGLARAMVAADGDVALGAPPPEAIGWRIAIGDPRTPDGPAFVVLHLAHAGISTSGASFQFVDVGGVRYAHIVDLRTGLGLVDPWQVTVLAGDATTSDAAATLGCILGPTRGDELLRHSGVRGALFLAPTLGRDGSAARGFGAMAALAPTRAPPR